MMKGIRKLAAWALTGVVALGSMPGLAANYAANGEYTAYAGPDGYLYLVDAQGAAKRMRAKDLDILSMDAEDLYFASGTKIYSINLAAGQASVKVNAADEETLLSYRLKGSYTVGDDGRLYLGETQVAQGVACASANSTTLYFAMDEGDGCALYSMPLDGGEMKREKPELSNPLAIAAAENYVIILDAGEVKAYDTAKWKTKKVKLPDGEAEDMFLRGKELALYVRGDDLTLETQTLSYVTPVQAVEPMPEQNQKTESKAEKEPEEKAEEPQQDKQETAEQEAEPTEAPAKQETKKSTVDTTGWKTLRRGNTGKNVRTVQNRLRKLGYPVGEVDGDYGSKTIRAMRFFQAIAGLEITGLTDAETYAALMADDAPKYDGRGKVASSSKKDDDETTETTPDDDEGGDGEGIGGAAGGESSGSDESAGGGESAGSGESSGSDESTGSGESAGSGESSGSGESTGGGESAGSGESSGSGESAGSGESTGGGESSGSGESAGSGESSGSGSVEDTSPDVTPDND